MHLVDTSAWLESFRPGGDGEVRRAVDDAMSDGEAALCDMILLELWVGARGAAEQATIGRLAASLTVVPIDADVWTKAHALARTCRAAGITVPTPDLVIAACADHHGMQIIERDAHF